MDRERILSKISELKGYLEELRKIVPSKFEDYEKSIKERRACERLLQISIECALDICDIVFSGLKLGLPISEEDIIERLNRANVFTDETAKKLKEMRKLRNILVHRYPYVNDKKIFKSLTTELKDFDIIIKEILKFLERSE